MATIGGHLPARAGGRTGSAAEPETIYHSDRTAARRVTLPDGAGTFVLKEPLGPGADQRRRHEIAILGRLAGVEGVCQLGAIAAGPDVIVLEYVPGDSLCAMPRLAVADLVELAVRLAEVVARVHRRGVVHKDICPANVIVTAAGAPTLIDFEL